MPPGAEEHGHIVGTVPAEHAASDARVGGQTPAAFPNPAERQWADLWANGGWRAA
jgi:hypothetical protein